MLSSLARGLLLAISALLILLGAAIVTSHGAVVAAWLAGLVPPDAGGYGLVIMGLLILAGVLLERWRYKPLERTPGPGFVATAERFVDPGSGRPVRVYAHPATGERRYVDDAGA